MEMSLALVEVPRLRLHMGAEPTLSASKPYTMLCCVDMNMPVVVLHSASMMLMSGQ